MKPKFDPKKPAVCVRGHSQRFPARFLAHMASNRGVPQLVYIIDYGEYEDVSYFYEDGTSNLGDNRYLVNAPEKRIVWRYTVVRPACTPYTFYWNTEEIAREGCAKWETVEGAIVLEPPHPFEYEVPG